MATNVADWRAAIDFVDRQLVELLNTRAKLACELGKVKRANGLHLVDSERERQVLAGVCRNNGGPLDHEAVQRIFESIIAEAKRIQAQPDAG